MIYTHTLTAEKDISFKNIGSAIRTDHIHFDVIRIPYKSGTFQWFVKNDTTDADNLAISGNSGSYNGGQVDITFSVWKLYGWGYLLLCFASY